jgi:hypothetical protein
MIGATDGTRRETAYAGFIVSYSPEYLRFSANPIVLRDIAQKTGGVELDANQNPVEMASTIFGDRQPKRSSRPIFDWFLMCIACLLPLDVAIRRVQMDFGWVKRLFRSHKRESTATMGALLQRAGEVRASMTKDHASIPGGSFSDPSTSRPMATRPQSQRPPATTAQKPETKPSTPTAPNSPGPPTEGGTTSRLLEIKRRREQDGEGKKE